MSRSLIWVLLALLVGCSQKNTETPQTKPSPTVRPTPPPPPPPSSDANSDEPKGEDAVTYHLPLEQRAATSFDRDETKLYQRIREGKPVSFKKITKILREMQLSAHNVYFPMEPVDPKYLKVFFDKVSESQEETSDPYQAKLQYEAKIAQLGGKKLGYRLKAVTLGWLVRSQEMQCYTGTMLQQLLWRGHENHREQNPVVIFRKGHVLSGFVKRVEGEWHLFGIETTFAGRGMVKFGAVKDLKGPIVIVDAEYFALMEIFKWRIQNGKVIAEMMRKLTADRIGLDLAKTSPPGDWMQEPSYENNSTFFAFGAPVDAPAQRPEIDEIDASELEGKEARSDVRNALEAPPGDQYSVSMVKVDRGRLQGTSYVMNLKIKGQTKTYSLELPFSQAPGAIPAERLLPIKIVKLKHEENGAEAPFPILMEAELADGLPSKIRWRQKDGKAQVEIIVGVPWGERP